MSTILVTYCTGQKNETDLPIPAVQLYNSDRIDAVAMAAKNLNLSFIILSGKFGLINSQDRIDYYDHRLTENEVEEHAKLIESQIKLNRITSILYFVNSSKIDPLNKAYISCLKLAATTTKIALTITEFDIFD